MSFNDDPQNAPGGQKKKKPTVIVEELVPVPCTSQGPSQFIRRRRTVVASDDDDDKENDRTPPEVPPSTQKRTPSSRTSPGRVTSIPFGDLSICDSDTPPSPGTSAMRVTPVSSSNLSKYRSNRPPSPCTRSPSPPRTPPPRSPRTSRSVSPRTPRSVSPRTPPLSNLTIHERQSNRFLLPQTPPRKLSSVALYDLYTYKTSVNKPGPSHAHSDTETDEEDSFKGFDKDKKPYQRAAVPDKSNNNKTSMHSNTSAEGTDSIGYIDINVRIHLKVGKHELTSIRCQVESGPKVASPVLPRESDGSGYLGDGSHTGSSRSSLPTFVTPTLQNVFNRVSSATNSSGASFPNSMSAAAAHRLSSLVFPQSLDVDKISYLIKKWKNSNIIYELLNCVDKLMLQEHITATLNNKFKPCLEPVDETSISKKREIERTVEDLPNNKKLKASACTIIGKQVFAKWIDGNYYYGYIKDTLEHCLVVEYFNKLSRSVERDQLIIDLTSLIGLQVMATDMKESNRYTAGIMIDIMDGGVGNSKCVVLTDTGDFHIELANIYILGSVIREMKRSKPLQSEDDDYLSGSDSSDTSEVNELRKLNLKFIAGCELETRAAQNLTPDMKLKQIPGKPLKRGSNNDDDLVGPLLESSIFQGLHFLLSGCETRHIYDTDGKEESPPSTDNEHYPFTAKPFLYRRLQLQLQAGGGTVYEFFEDVHRRNYDNTYLITHRTSMTPTFIKCVCMGLTIVNHEWVIDCILEGKRLLINELPAGWSIERCRFTERYERKGLKPLDGYNIQIINLSREFKTFWKDILIKLGAFIVEFGLKLDNVHAILIDPSAFVKDLNYLFQLGLPLVTTSWVIQCAITGKPCSYEGHHSFDYLFDSDESD